MPRTSHTSRGLHSTKEAFALFTLVAPGSNLGIPKIFQILRAMSSERVALRVVNKALLYTKISVVVAQHTGVVSRGNQPVAMGTKKPFQVRLFFVQMHLEDWKA